MDLNMSLRNRPLISLKTNIGWQEEVIFIKINFYSEIEVVFVFISLFKKVLVCNITWKFVYWLRVLIGNTRKLWKITTTNWGVLFITLQHSVLVQFVCMNPFEDVSFLHPETLLQKPGDHDSRGWTNFISSSFSPRQYREICRFTWW